MNNTFPRYHNGIEKYVDRGSIPKLLKKGEALSLHHKYYLPEFHQKCKCTSIDQSSEFIFYSLSGDQYQYVLSHPIMYDCYKFVPDKSEILGREIIGDNHIYYGYQVKYWLYLRINQYKYHNFRNLLYTLEDDYSYKVYGRLENGKYVGCRIVLKYKNDKKKG